MKMPTRTATRMAMDVRMIRTISIAPSPAELLSLIFNELKIASSPVIMASLRAAVLW